MEKDFKTQRVRGSAIYYQDGSYSFTPYNTNPTENSKWYKLADCRYGKLQMTQKVVQMLITVPVTDPDNIVKEFHNRSAELAGKFLGSRAQEIFERAKGERRK